MTWIKTLPEFVHEARISILILGSESRHCDVSAMQLVRQGGVAQRLFFGAHVKEFAQ